MTIPQCLFLVLATATLTAPWSLAAPDGDRWAVVVGVDKCMAVGELKTCVSDAKAIKAKLQQLGYGNIKLLVDNQPSVDTLPTKNNVERAVTGLVDVAGPKDMILFFFSGHGDTDSGENYLIPTDGSRANGIKLSWLVDKLTHANAAKTVLILDACHSGGAKGVSGITPDLKTQGKLYMLLSCDKNQVSWPDTKGKYSVFTKAVLDGLSGQAADAEQRVTLQSLTEYVQKTVKKWTFDNMKDLQTPMLAGEMPQEVVLVAQTERPHEESPFDWTRAASEHWTPFQLSLAPPLQAVPSDWGVKGMRLGVVYSSNRDVGVLDIGLINRTSGTENGLQIGAINNVKGVVSGVQVAGVMNAVDRNSMVDGGQIAGINLAGEVSGLQVGVINKASSMQGAQIGLINMCNKLDGAQIGLINWNKDGAVPFLPIVNFGF